MHLLEALHVRQQHDANRNKNAAKRRRARRKEKERREKLSSVSSSTNICALPDTGVFSQKLSKDTVRLL